MRNANDGPNDERGSRRMNVERAHQILHSAEKVNVTWQGRSVWIDSVDAESGTARVHAENNPNEVMNVPVRELREQ